MLGGGKRTTLGRVGQLQGCFLAPIATAVHAPCSSFHTKGHVRIIASVPQAHKKVARDMSVDTFVPC